MAKKTNQVTESVESVVIVAENPEIVTESGLMAPLEKNPVNLADRMPEKVESTEIKRKGPKEGSLKYTSLPTTASGGINSTVAWQAFEAFESRNLSDNILLRLTGHTANELAAKGALTEDSYVSRLKVWYDSYEKQGPGRKASPDSLTAVIAAKSERLVSIAGKDAAIEALKAQLAALESA